MLKGLRWVLMALLAVAIVSLSFTLGFGVDQIRGGGREAAPRAPAQGQRQPAAPTAATREKAPSFDVLSEIYDILSREHVDRELLDPETLRTFTINGLLQGINDPHTSYIDAKSYECGSDIVSGSFQGIGARVEMRRGEVTIVTPFPGSPAEKAGLRAGDVVLAVDGKSTAGWTLSQAVCRIRGPSGVRLELTVRHIDGKVEDLGIVRGRIAVESVATLELQDAQGRLLPDIAYLEIQQFTDRTPQEVRRFLQGMRGKSYRGLIIDLRRNPGGLLSSTLQIANFFLEGDAVILSEVDAEGQEKVYRATPRVAVDPNLPIVVLVGRGSASGSEVLAAALRDNGRAVLIGEQTFGKGSVNVLRRLKDGGALYLTTSRWRTPKGQQIEGMGLFPDLEVRAEASGGPLFNAQLFRAVEYLRQQAQAPTGAP